MDTDNPEEETSDAPADPRISTNELLPRLQRESTLILFFYTLVTLGIYAAHYIKSQTTIVNGFLDEANQLSTDIAMAILVLSYVSVALLLPTFFIDPQSQLVSLCDAVNTIVSILILIWVFMARSKMNRLLDSTRGTETWFHGLWTFLFSVFYFNFKVNTLNERNGNPLTE